jgi:hypothetical protein
MKHAHNRLSRAVGGLLAVAGTLVTATAQNLEPVPQEQVAQISALIGAQLTAKPAKKRNVLVFWRCEGFVHGKALEYGNAALALAAEKTQAFKADFSNDYESLTPANLAKYDALVLNNTTGLKTQENRFIEPALVAFVRSGKGLAVIHAGADNFGKAGQACEMVGGHFWGHPWGGGGTWAFKLDEPAHPLNQAFGGKGFTFGDEIYQQESPFYNRAKLRVLVSLDLADKTTAEAKDQRREDKDYAVSWVRPYGKGRVFYTSFGHDQRAFLNKAVLAHILDGLQYALGDLKADDTPAGLSAAELNRVKTATDANANEVFGYLQDIATHTYAAKVDAANKAKLEALLKDSATTPFGKKTILRVLQSSFDGTQDLGPVAACLQIPETRDWASSLLAGTPGKAADKALVQALAAADAPLRCTLLNAAAIRRSAAAVTPYLADKDPSVATAALAALGRIGTEDAAQALAKPAAANLEETRLTALAACIGTLAYDGQSKAAARAAKPVFADTAKPSALRAAAARALLLADVDFFMTGLKDADPMVRQTVIRAAAEVPVKTLAAALKSATPGDQAALIAKLAARDAKACAPAVAESLKSEQDPVVCAALRALVKIGGAGQVPAMFALTAREGAVGQTATESLTDMRDPAAGKELLALAAKDPAQQTKALGILGERTEAALIPQFEPFLKSDSADIRKETWKALGKQDANAFFAQGVAWLPLVKDAEINQAEAALRASAKSAEPAARTAALVSAWKSATTSSKKVLAGLMANFADPAFIAPLSGALSDADIGLREAALNALADWPTLDTFAALKDAVGTQTDAGLKTMALRGALKVAAANAGADTRARFLELFKLAPDEKGRMTVADALFKSDGLELFTSLQGLFSDPACGAFAKKTYVAFFEQKVKQQAGLPSREIAPSKWKASASHAGNDAGRAFDRDAGSRWSSNHSSEKGMWFSLDLGENTYVSEAVLDTEKSGSDTPNGYEVFTSGDGKTWAGPVAQGDGSSKKKTVIPLAVQARHLKFVTTGGRPGLHWSIHEIYVKAGLDQTKIDAISKIADSAR